MAQNYKHNMKSIDAMIIRGGSSKGVYLDIDDLPPKGKERDQVVLKIFGSPVSKGRLTVWVGRTS